MFLTLVKDFQFFISHTSTGMAEPVQTFTSDILCPFRTSFKGSCLSFFNFLTKLLNLLWEFLIGTRGMAAVAQCNDALLSEVGCEHSEQYFCLALKPGKSVNCASACSCGSAPCCHVQRLTADYNTATFNCVPYRAFHSTCAQSALQYTNSNGKCTKQICLQTEELLSSDGKNDTFPQQKSNRNEPVLAEAF